MGYNSLFVEFLHNEVYKKRLTIKRGGRKEGKGYYNDIDWIYVNINNKRYAFGIPGIAITEQVGKHVITIKEFKIIYVIYKKV